MTLIDLHKDASWHPDKSRKIKKRIVIKGDLVLRTPASLSNGDSHDQIDLPLLTDALAGGPLLTGASLAGALRSYLKELNADYTNLLFGTSNTSEPQSPLIVEDALGDGKEVEVRDGVRLDTASRTAVKDALYNRECWAAGTRFPLVFELIIGEQDDEAKLRQALATALQGFEKQHIPLGGRKTRGYGRAWVKAWQVWEYDLTTPVGLSSWVYQNGASTWVSMETGSFAPLLPDERGRFVMDAKFWLDGSLLIRSADRGENAPDTVHLKAKRVGQDDVAVLSGTSLAGAIRARALKIANTLQKQDAIGIIDALFGPLGKPGQKLAASRVHVWEHEIKQGIDHLVQSRVSIDRFTGGARDQLLFNQQPIFGDETTIVTLHIELKKPPNLKAPIEAEQTQEAAEALATQSMEADTTLDSEVGLLLLLLKDLWTGDLPLGGESNVGRGRLCGKEATLKYKRVDYTIKANPDGTLQIADEARTALEAAVAAWSARQ